MSENRKDIWILVIVAIVAIVGLIVLMKSSNMAAVAEEPLALEDEPDLVGKATSGQGYPDIEDHPINLDPIGLDGESIIGELDQLVNTLEESDR